MHLVFTRYYREHLDADTAEYVYERTTENSKLRQFIRDLVLDKGPLRSRDRGDTDQVAKKKEEWKELIRRKCDLVVDVALEGGSFVNASEGSKPYHPENHQFYFEPVVGRPIEEFLEGKAREGTR